MRLDAVIFDMDGVLLDSERIVRDAFLLIAAQHGFQISDEIDLSMVGRNSHDSRKIISERISPDFPWLAVEESMTLAIKERINDIWPLKPGALEILHFLKTAGVRLAVGTSTAAPQARKRLASAGILDFFRTVTGGDEVTRGKPEPDIFHLAAERLKVNPEHCLVIEDSHYGVAAARAAGMSCALIPDLKIPADETRQLAWKVFDSLHQLQSELKLMTS